MRLPDIADAPLPPGTKGLPLDGSVERLSDLNGWGLNLLQGDLPMPVAVLKRTAVENNLKVMQAYTARAGVKLAPHAKTTMCPQLFARQLDHGAWGLSVATMVQFRLCHEFGVERLILANQLVGRAEIEAYANFCAETPGRDYFVLVDSLDGARAISAGVGRVPNAPPAKLLIEVGMTDGRCGVRTPEDGLELARHIAALPGVALHGIEGYEGLIASDDPARDALAVSAYLEALLGLWQAASDEGLFADPAAAILSAGGSAYYDLVARLVVYRPEGLVPVLRSGCYVTHDSGFYRRLLTHIADRKAAGPAPGLMPALEVWTRVISRPQPGQAIVMMGKRDVSFDIDLPMARQWYREGVHDAPQAVSGLTVDRLSDQHGFLAVAEGVDLAVGDLLGFDISHPCTTFDKWSVLMEVDDDYTVVSGLKTFF
jgi:D-serine dehydratase